MARHHDPYCHHGHYGHLDQYHDGDGGDGEEDGDGDGEEDGDGDGDAASLSLRLVTNDWKREEGGIRPQRNRQPISVLKELCLEMKMTMIMMMVLMMTIIETI